MRKLRLFRKLLILSALLLAVLLASAWIYLGSDSFSLRAKGWIISTLEARFPLEAEVDSVRLRLWGLVFEVEGLRIFEKGRPSGEPAIDLGRAKADLPLGFWRRPGLSLDRLELEGSVFRLRRKESGRLNLAEMFSAGSAGRESALPPVRIDDLSIRNGLLRYNQRDIPLNFSRFGVQAQIQATPNPGEYSGRMVLQGFELQTDRITLPPSRIEVVFRADSRQVSRLEASLTGPGLEVALQGRINDLENLRYSFDFQAQGEFDAFRSPGFLTPVEQALFKSQGRLLGQGGEFHYQGRLEATQVSVLGRLFEGLETRIDLNPQRAEFRELKARLSGSELQSSGVLGIGSQVESRMKVGLRDFDFSGQFPFLEGRATVQANLNWPGLEWEKMQGEGRLSYRAAARLDRLGSGLLEALHLQGDSSLRMSGSTVQLPDARAVGEGTEIDFQAQADWMSWRYVTDFKVRESNGQRLLEALLEEIGEPIPQALRRGLSSHGALLAEGRLEGGQGEIQLNGRLNESRLDWEGRPLGRFQTAFQIRQGILRLAETRLEGSGLKLEAGQIGIPLDRPKAAQLDLKARLDRLPLQRFHSLISELAAAGIRPKGHVSGPLQLTRDATKGWRLESALRVDEPSLRGQSLDWLEADVLLEDAALGLRDLRGSIGAGTISGSLRLDGQGRLEGQAQGRRIPLQSISPLQEWLPLEGQADFRLTADGLWEDPRFDVTVDCQNLSYSGRHPQIPLHLRAWREGGKLKFLANHQMPDRRFKGSGDLTLSPAWELDAELTLDSLPLSPYLALLGKAPAAALEGSASGIVTIRGPLIDPDRLSISANLNQAVVETAGYRLQATEPLIAKWDQGVVTIEPFRISGPQSSLQVSGNLKIAQPRTVQLQLEGRTNLRIFNDLIPSGVTWGEVEVSVIVSGSLDSPRMVGTAHVQRAFLFNPALPTPLVDASGSFKFSPSLISIDRFAASTNYGRVQALGSIFLDGLTPRRWKLNVFGTRLNVEFPADVHSTVDADIELLKSDTGQLATGTVTVHSSEYSEPVTLTDLVTRYMGRRQDTFYEGPAGDAALDVSVQGRRTLYIRNNLADLQASASLDLRGTLSSPVILGSLQVDQGKLFLEDNQYDINRGTINFNDPRRTTPHLNFEAETSVRDFLITASVQGTLDRPKIRFRSDPPLPTADIVSLLAVGETMNELAGPSASTSPTSMGMAAASRVLSRALQDSLESQTGRLFGLQKFSVDPFVAGTGTRRDPGARITVGRQLGKNLSVSYITDLGSENSGQIVIVEVQLRSWLTAVGSREEDGSLAIDFKLKKRF